MNLISIKWKVKCIVKRLELRLIFGNRLQIDKHASFRDNFHVWIEKKGKVVIGKSFFNNGCSITAHNRVVIGDKCLFGEDVKIYDHNHVFKYGSKPIESQGFKIGTVYIGNNCWIGSGCIILKGASIGNGCVIAAGRVIDCTIPAHSIVKKDGTVEKIHYVKEGD